MAPNMDFLCRELSFYLTERLSIPTRVVMDIPWQEREHLLDAGEIDFCWICGLPYVWKADRTQNRIEPLVAPVMSGRRYKDLPIYFSDVVVHRDSTFQRITDLRGATWAYNEPNSHSGYGVVRYALALKGETLDFFSGVTESGAHQNSLAMVLSKKVDGSAIDSTVLEQEIARFPEIADQIRIVDSIGPSPMPPWVISKSISTEVRQALLETLTQMDMDPMGQRILAGARMSRFAPVSDVDYDPIRKMASIAFGNRSL